ncbi:unnamed protein product [Paramecium octaurelia]|uniref:Uncharacterized protein n=1 Tax=Paramecium octaurelia TaxID=43137 RepID=A0A8S1TBN5_PAROT|nr:unnamed protein product [Paramecium octaurelia]
MTIQIDFAKIIGFFRCIQSYLPIYIYNLLYRRFYKKWTCVMMCDRLEKKISNVKRNWTLEQALDIT